MIRGRLGRARNNFSTFTILYCSLIPRIKSESTKTKNQTHYRAEKKTLQKPKRNQNRTQTQAPPLAEARDQEDRKGKEKKTETQSQYHVARRRSASSHIPDTKLDP